MDFGSYMIVMVKTNAKGVFKETIEKLTKQLDRMFLTPVEEEDYVSRRKANYLYWIQV